MRTIMLHFMSKATMNQKQWYSEEAMEDTRKKITVECRGHKDQAPVVLSLISNSFQPHGLLKVTRLEEGGMTEFRSPLLRFGSWSSWAVSGARCTPPQYARHGLCYPGCEHSQCCSSSPSLPPLFQSRENTQRGQKKKSISKMDG